MRLNVEGQRVERSDVREVGWHLRMAFPEVQLMNPAVGCEGK